MSEHEQEEFLGGRDGAYASEKNESELTDSNEQELRKAGFFISSAKRAAPKSVPSDALPVRPDSRQALVKKSKARDSVAKRREKALLPNQASQTNQIKKSEASADGVKANRPSEQSKKEEKRASLLPLRILLSTSLLIAAAILSLAILTGNRLVSASPSEESEPDALTEQAPSDTAEQKVVFVKPYGDADGVLTAAELYERYADAVVSILSENERASELGSGFILSEDGYIVTAYHVVEDMTEVSVLLSDGRQYAAVSVTGDAMTDLAVLKIDATGLSTVTLGKSSSLLTGEPVVSIGTAASAAYAGTLCTGEISYLWRTVPIYDSTTGALQKKMTLMQTNLALNPGSSGAPVFNEYGEVVGIVTMRLGGDYADMSFAIPADGALPIVSALMAGQQPDDSLRSAIAIPASRLGIVGEADHEDGRYGVRILNFSSDQSSCAAMLREGDLILQIDGQAVRSTSDITEQIATKNPGMSVEITVLRSEQELTFPVVLEARSQS